MVSLLVQKVLAQTQGQRATVVVDH